MAMQIIDTLATLPFKQLKEIPNQFNINLSK